MSIKGIKDIDLGFDAIVARTRTVGDKVVEVGVFAPELATIGAYNELGTRTAPARPFLRNAFDANEQRYAQAMAEGAARILAGTSTEAAELTRLGLVASGDVKRSITELAAPPNAPATIKAKGSSNPLIDTGALRNAVAFEVVAGGGASEGGEG